MPQGLAQLQRNLQQVRERIAAAAHAANRDPTEVTLVAVTKYVDEQVIRELVTAGCDHLGESRPQELWHKAASLHDLPVRWHQIGHLQRNKLRRTLPIVSLIHSVDSLRLLRAMETTAAQWSSEDDSMVVHALLEVNVSGDEAKHGFPPKECREAVELAQVMAHVRIQGLMCMAGRAASQSGARRDFAALRELRYQLQDEFDDASLDELSMGMSGDFEEAIEAGSTIVRVGSALFEGVTS